MSSSQSDEPQNPSPDPTTKTPDQESTDPPPTNENNQEHEDEEEEEGECGFCLFMKGGGCKEVFINWENCIEEGEKNKENIVDKCFDVTSALKKCMEAHSDYYAPILQAENAAEQEAINQLNKEKEAAAAVPVAGASDSGAEEQKPATSLTN
ncbi:hypothetical protein HanIR_Chr12g0605511 [Helianthus annuus]|nr:hypothetical protein HanIR_Chr12g0605511 [Helianthus annuus]